MIKFRWVPRLPAKCALDASLVKKRVRFNFSKVSLQFDLSESLFSSLGVDVGTRALLNSLRKNKAIEYSKILDLGCGYGPIGLFLKAQDPSREVHMVDRDALAVAFASRNAQLNGLAVKVYSSLDYEQVDGEFSLIATNFPAKTATKGLQVFVYGASGHLASEGVLAIVVVRELTRRLKRILNMPEINVLYEELKKGYSIFHVGFSAAIRPSAEKYERQETILQLSKRYTVRTAFGLPEFDALSFGTHALISLLRDMKRYDSVFVLEPGQGHGAVAVIDLLSPSGLTLGSRDLLSLRFAARNVRSNFGFEPRTTLLPYLHGAPEEELTVWNVQRKKDLRLNLHNMKVLMEGGRPLLVYGRTQLLATLLRKMPVTVLRGAVEKHYSARLLKPTESNWTAQ